MGERKRRATQVNHHLDTERRGGTNDRTTLDEDIRRDRLEERRSISRKFIRIRERKGERKK